MNEDIKTIVVTDAQIPFADLYLSDLNPRSIVNDEAIELLAANIRKLGLIQNPAGLRDADGKVAIVAGGRRYRALAMLQDEERFQTVTVRMAPDQATAEFWATSENAQRERNPRFWYDERTRREGRRHCRCLWRDGEARLSPLGPVKLARPCSGRFEGRNREPVPCCGFHSEQ